MLVVSFGRSGAMRLTRSGNTASGQPSKGGIGRDSITMQGKA